MKEDTTVIQFRHADSIEDPLTEIAREGARRLLSEALKAEADAFVASFADDVLPDGRQRVVRHGYGPEQSVQTGIGAIDVPPSQGAGPGCWDLGPRTRVQGSGKISIHRLRQAKRNDCQSGASRLSKKRQ